MGGVGHALVALGDRPGPWPDAAVLAWIARQFPELDQDTVSVGDAIHASQSSLRVSRKGVLVVAT